MKLCFASQAYSEQNVHNVQSYTRLADPARLVSELSINTTKVCGPILILSTNDKIGKVRVLHERAVSRLLVSCQCMFHLSSLGLHQCHNTERERLPWRPVKAHTWLRPSTRHGGRVASGSAGVNICYSEENREF